MKRLSSWRKNLPVVASLVFAGLLAIRLLIVDWSAPELNGISMEKVESEDGADVLGQWSESKKSIYISGSRGYNNGGMIALASTDDPSVVINSWDVNGEVEVLIYKAGVKDLLAYLLHDDEGNQINSEVNVDSLDYVTSLTHRLNNEQSLLLPLENTGVYFLVIAKGEDVKSYAFVVRSETGVILKEGENEFIFWGQNYNTRRSINSGELRLYSLEGSEEELYKTEFGEQGLATTGLLSSADIGVYENDGDVAVVPINLQYLNTNYSWQRFKPQQALGRYFVFTDRPLYRPGDKVYIKAMLREESDVRYSIPSGSAQVEVSSGWGDNKKVLFDESLPISRYGGVDAEVELPEETETGYYQVAVTVGGLKQNEWGGYSNYGGVGFQVEHFRKPEYTLEVKADDLELVTQDEIAVGIEGKYFIGQPLAGESINYKVTAGKYYDYSYYTNYENSITDSYRYGAWNGREVQSGELTLDSDGLVRLSLTTTPHEGMSQVYSIEVSYADETGNQVMARKNVLVYAGEFGIYRERGRYGFRVGDEIELPIQIVAYESESVSGRQLSAEVKRVEWEKHVVENKKHPEYRKVEEELGQVKVKTNKEGQGILRMKANKAGSYFFEVTVVDDRGNEVKKTFNVWVSDVNRVSYISETGNNLSIQADREEYEPGDVAEVNITSSISDRDVLLSLERGRVNRYQVVNIEGNQATVKLPLVGTDMPNIFAKTTSFSDAALDNANVNLVVSAEQQRMKVNLIPDKQRYGPGETVTLDVLTTNRGGQPLETELAVWAVDKALFELVYEQPKDIFDAFWYRRSNGTQQAHSLESIGVQNAEMGGGCFTGDTSITMADGSRKNIDQVKVGDVILTKSSGQGDDLVEAEVMNTHERTASGYLIINNSLKVTANHKLWVNGSWRNAGSLQVGDMLTSEDGSSMMVDSIEWQQRKTQVYNLYIDKFHTYFADGIYVHNSKGGERNVFEDTAYWNPVVRTNALGIATLRFDLPDNLTTWVISGVGSTMDTVVGQTNSEILVSKNVVVRPVVPNIMRIGDTIKIAALVNNFTDQEHVFDVSLGLDWGEVDEATHAGVVLGPSKVETMDWEVKPTKRTENGELVFTMAAVGGDADLRDTLVHKMPVRPFGYMTKSAEVGDGDVEYEVGFGSDVDMELSSVELSLSPTLVGTLPQSMKYLISYPYGCVEQTTSRLVPLMIAKNNSDIFGEVLKGREVGDMEKKGLGRLLELQQSDGGWGWWTHNESDPFVSAYVLEYLLMAEEMDSTGKMVSEVKSYFENLKPDDDSDKVARSYALSLFSSSAEFQVREGLDKLEADLLAWAVMANLRSGLDDPTANGLKILENQAQAQGEGVYWKASTKGRFGSEDASTSLALRALLKARGSSDLITKAVRYLERSRRQSYWSNTFATSQVIQSLTDYATISKELAPDYGYKVYLDNNVIEDNWFSDANHSAVIEINPTDVAADGSKVRVVVGGDGKLYSTLLVNEFHTDSRAQAIDHGLKVTREYVNDKGEEYDLAVGDSLRVRLKVEGLEAVSDYVVIEDQLPAGMIPVNRKFKSEVYGRQAPWYWQGGVRGRDVTESGVVISVSQLKPGQNVYEYEARVINAGEYQVPPAYGAMMYAPEVWGQSEVKTIKVESKQHRLPLKVAEKMVTQQIDGKRAIMIAGGLLVSVGIVFGISKWRKRRHDYLRTDE